MEGMPVATGTRKSESAQLQQFAPLLFGLLAYAVIKLHGASPARSLPTLAWCLLGLGGVLFAAMRLSGHRLTISRPTGWLLFSLAASMIASNVLLSDISWSAPRLGIYIADVLLALSVYLMYRDTSANPLRSYFVAIGLVHAFFLIEAVLWVAQSGPEFFTKSMRISNFAHVRHFGYLGFLAAISGSALVVLRGRPSLLPLATTASAVFGIVLTGSRGALLSWFFFIALLYIYFPVHRLRLVVHALLASAGAFATVWALHASGVLPSPNIFARVRVIVDGAGTFDSGRLEIWLGALREIAARPLFGFGTEAYQLSGCCNTTVVQPHNFVLQLLMQFGLVGNALLLALGWRAVAALGGGRAVVLRVKASSQSLLLATMLAAYLAFGLIDGLLYNAVPLLHFALLCGLFAATLKGRFPSMIREFRINQVQ